MKYFRIADRLELCILLKMTFQSCLSALLGLAILSLCNIALVNAGDENTVYAVHANVCTYREHNRWQIRDKVELLKAPAKVIRVPVGLPCALRYNTNTTHWDCMSTNNETPPAKGTAIFMVKGLKDPDSGNAVKTVATQRHDGYIVADTVAKSHVLWSKGFAVISQPGDTQQFLCIKNGSQHPRVFGLTLKLPGDVGDKSEGRFGSRSFVRVRGTKLPTLVVANRPSGKFPPVWELTYEGEYAKGKKWELKLMNGEVDAKQVVGRGIAIKAVKDKKNKDAVTFSLVKASSWPPKHGGKSTVAYIVPAPTFRVKFSHGKAIFDKDLTDSTKTRFPSIKIELEKLIVIEIPEIPEPLEMLTAVTELPADHIEINSHQTSIEELRPHKDQATQTECGPWDDTYQTSFRPEKTSGFPEGVLRADTDNQLSWKAEETIIEEPRANMNRETQTDYVQPADRKRQTILKGAAKTHMLKAAWLLAHQPATYNHYDPIPLNHYERNQ